ncbi:Protein kinase-like domain [Pseudocohnilembus persalinus]|uniref:non-specific serine/threonine protein kinase n=1 Tax=Pseudocohnilembus persalinus TaxID=266149 RepID=A0A0V0QG43_PSEPJ|nr:Protein kinase-like domain [Pseudocohnilembus persalinus]|eukprot:KRX01182.1 Protein kinase-like domain [Pseudocohnilembus persalinus]
MIKISQKKVSKQQDRCEQELKNFQIKQKLGEGSYSSVYKVHRISDNISYAMKKIKLNNLNQKEKENAVNEVRFLASINNPNIVAYKDSIFDDKQNFLYIIMEYMPGGDVLQKLRQLKKQGQFLDENTIWRYFIQITRGLKGLHDLKILHRDLKCANIFLSKEGQDAKIGDLNVSKVAKQGLLYTQTGTPYYASPEVWQDKPYNSKSDIWSLGCVLYEMCELHPPFMGQDMKALFKRIKMGTFAPINSRFSDDLQKLISQCLNINHSKRPSCEQILNSQIVQQKIEILNLNLNSSQSTDCTGSGTNSNESSFQKQLLNTIRVGTNLKNLSAKLPNQHYENNEKSDNVDKNQNSNKRQINSGRNIIQDQNDFPGSQLAVVKCQKRKKTVPSKNIDICNMLENNFPVKNQQSNLKQKQIDLNKNVQNIINNQYLISQKQPSINSLVNDDNNSNNDSDKSKLIYNKRKSNSNIHCNKNNDNEMIPKSEKQLKIDFIIKNYVNGKKKIDFFDKNEQKPPFQQVNLPKGPRPRQMQQSKENNSHSVNALNKNGIYSQQNLESSNEKQEQYKKSYIMHESLGHQNSIISQKQQQKQQNIQLYDQIYNDYSKKNQNNNNDDYLSPNNNNNRSFLPHIKSSQNIDISYQKEEDNFQNFSKNLSNIQSAKKNYINSGKQQSCLTLDDVNYAEYFNNNKNNNSNVNNNISIISNGPQSQKSQQKKVYTENVQTGRILSNRTDNSRKYIFQNMAAGKILPPSKIQMHQSQQEEINNIIQQNQKGKSLNNSKNIQDLNFKKGHSKNHSSISAIFGDQKIEDFINQIQKQPYQIQNILDENLKNGQYNQQKNTERKENKANLHKLNGYLNSLNNSNHQQLQQQQKQKQKQSQQKNNDISKENQNYSINSISNNNSLLLNNKYNYDVNQNQNEISKKNKIEYNPLFMPNSNKDLPKISEVSKIPRAKQNIKSNFGVFFSQQQIQN